jgi:hypothetical protein
VSELENFLMDKTAEVSGTHLMQSGAAPQALGASKLNPAGTIRKVAESVETVGALEKNDGVGGEQIDKLPQAAPIRVHVDTTGKDAPAAAPATKEAHTYALPAFSRYPLDSYAQVKQADAYFQEWGDRFAPVLRREYCSNLVKRASALGIEVCPKAAKYGSVDYASQGELDAALLMRNGVLKEASHKEALVMLGGFRETMQPEDFAVALSEFDKVAGIDHLYDRDVYDPWFTTFGSKTASDDGAILVGNDYISQQDLKNFAKTNSCKLKDTFGEDFAEEFRKDPVAITKSLPVDQKKIVIRLAASSLTDPTTT